MFRLRRTVAPGGYSIPQNPRKFSAARAAAPGPGAIFRRKAFRAA